MTLISITKNTTNPYLMFLSKTSCLALVMTCSAPVFSQSLDLRFEVKTNYRDSEQFRFSSAFPFTSTTLAEGERNSFIETVDDGGSAEVSLISVAGKWQLSDLWQLRFKVDAVDLYDRNPTSGDSKIDIDALFLRYGNAFGATKIPSKNSAYVQIGKFKKFEQQRERRTESYGVVSTAFNRFEDSGLEAGFDLPSGFYGRLSYTTGNPVFIRDVNALAGNLGSQDLETLVDSPEPNRGSGIVTLYDAEVEDFDLSGVSELGIGLGYRWNSPNNKHQFDVLAYHYERDLAETRELGGTFFGGGGDLDLLDVSEVPGAEGARLPFSGDKKTESGVTAWYNSGNFSLFSQYVTQEIADLDRNGFEIELSYVFDLPIKITPVLRYSELNNNFANNPLFPTPSLGWDWRKIDYAINFQFSDNVSVIAEYADNEIVTAISRESQNELLLTLHWQFGYSL